MPNFKRIISESHFAGARRWLNRFRMQNNGAWASPTKYALLLLCMVFPLQVWSAAGIIQSVSGEARISQRSGLERPAQRGVQLYEGDTVWTSKLSNVQIRMIDDAVIWVYPESRLKIDAYDNVAGKGRKGPHAALQLLVGALRTVTGTINKDYALTTPNATIGIRGTDFTAVFIPQGGSTQDTRGEPGTYNRVFQGATALDSNKTSINIAQGQAGFAALKPGTPPEILTKIPNFLNGSPTAPTPPAAAPAASSAPPESPRQLLVTVRFGTPPGDSRSSVTTSSRSASDESPEQSIQVLNGQRALMTFSQGTQASARPLPGITGAPGQSSTHLEVQPRLSGNSASVSFYAQSQTSSQGRTGPAQTLQVGTSLSVRLGEWTEVSGRGPWTSNQSSETTSSRSASPDMRRIFLKVDDITR